MPRCAIRLCHPVVPCFRRFGGWRNQHGVAATSLRLSRRPRVFAQDTRCSWNRMESHLMICKQGYKRKQFSRTLAQKHSGKTLQTQAGMNPCLFLVLFLSGNGTQLAETLFANSNILHCMGFMIYFVYTWWPFASKFQVFFGASYVSLLCCFPSVEDLRFWTTIMAVLRTPAKLKIWVGKHSQDFSTVLTFRNRRKFRSQTSDNMDGWKAE